MQTFHFYTRLSHLFLANLGFLQALGKFFYFCRKRDSPFPFPDSRYVHTSTNETFTASANNRHIRFYSIRTAVSESVSASQLPREPARHCQVPKD